MARSRRNEANRFTASVEAGLPDLTEITVSEAAPNCESGAAFETLNLDHTGLKNECRSGALAIGLGSYRGDSMAPRFAIRRLRRPPRCGVACSSPPRLLEEIQGVTRSRRYFARRQSTA